MTYETALKLKEVGFSQEGRNCEYLQTYHGELCGLPEKEHNEKCNDWDCRRLLQDTDAYLPLLEELIEACGEKFVRLAYHVQSKWHPTGERPWSAHARIPKGFQGGRIEVRGSTPSEAVANLWLALNKK